MPMQEINIGPELDKSHWPPGVRTLGINEVDLLGIDAEGTLYWNGKPVVVRRSLDLTRGQAALGWIVGIAAVVAALAAVVQAWAAWVSLK